MLIYHVPVCSKCELMDIASSSVSGRSRCLSTSSSAASWTINNFLNQQKFNYVLLLDHVKCIYGLSWSPYISLNVTTFLGGMSPDAVTKSSPFF